MKVNPNNFTEPANIVWTSLSSRQRQVIQADYPIKSERNSLICMLRGVKVEVQVLAEISGMSRQSISAVLNREVNTGKATLESLKTELKKIQKAVGRLGDHISRLEKNQG